MRSSTSPARCRPCCCPLCPAAAPAPTMAWRLPQPSPATASPTGLSAPGGADESSEREAKRSRAGGQTAATGHGAGRGGAAGAERHLVQLVAKLTLQTAQVNRDLVATTVVTYLVKADSPMATAGKKAAQNYSDSVRGRADHPYGPPSIHIWPAFVTALRDLATTPPKHKDTLTQYLGWLATPTLDMADLAQHIRLCYLKKTYRADKMKLMYALAEYVVDPADPETLTEVPPLPPPPALTMVERALQCSLRAAGAEQKLGRAPAGELERQISKMIRPTDA